MAQKITVLVAEDELDIRNLITFSLEYVGYRVIQAVNGEEAVERAVVEQPDLVLLDVRMPRLNGYEACKILKTQESTKHIPIVFLSARGQETEIKHGLELGAIEYILKPFAPDELQQRVTSILGRLGHKKGQLSTSPDSKGVGKR
jgi:DNA-binding response OmpR family regulator